jgi:monoterpene epsilon-lactone hydrolase
MPSREFEHILAQIRNVPVSAPTLSIAQARAQIEERFAALPPLAGARITPVNAGGVPAEWVQAPQTTDAATLLFLHGGGYNICSPRTHRVVTTHLSQGAGCRVLALDYRLAPEHPHPAAVDDAVAAYRWLLAQGIAPTRIGFAGDSAGGGLAVAAMVRLRDENTPLPIAAYLISPWVDLAGTGVSWGTNQELDPMLDRTQLDQMALAYLAGRDPRTPLASPLYADLAGLPPLLVHVGTHEVLLDDSIGLAARAEAAGVSVTLDRWKGMIHGFHMFAGMVPEADTALAAGGRFLRERLLTQWS